MPARPNSVSVIGAGSWGTALALVLARNIASVKLWGRDSAALADMARDGCNRRYLPGVDFPPNLQIEPRFGALVEAPLAFVLAVPSHAFRAQMESLHRSITDAGYSPRAATIIWGAKGFAPGGELLSEVVRDVFGEDGVHAAISGPSFAAETARFLPTALTLACPERRAAQSLAHWFRGPTTRVYFSADLVGVQLGGAIKNVMAIAAGISDGLGFGANARAALITRGLTELTRLGVALGGEADTFAGLTGLGDLILTCTDDQSRNRRFGLGLGRGEPPAQVCADIGQEIEGINTARELHRMSRELAVDMPITEQVYRIVHRGHDPKSAVRDLLRRDPKAEAASAPDNAAKTA